MRGVEGDLGFECAEDDALARGGAGDFGEGFEDGRVVGDDCAAVHAGGFIEDGFVEIDREQDGAFELARGVACEQANFVPGLGVGKGGEGLHESGEVGDEHG